MKKYVDLVNSTEKKRNALFSVKSLFACNPREAYNVKEIVKHLKSVGMGFRPKAIRKALKKCVNQDFLVKKYYKHRNTGGHISEYYINDDDPTIKKLTLFAQKL